MILIPASLISPKVNIVQLIFCIVLLSTILNTILVIAIVLIGIVNESKYVLLGGKFNQRLKTRSKIASKRSKMIKEVITYIKDIKFNAWEHIFKQKLETDRQQEKTLLMSIVQTRGLLASIMTAQVPLVSFICVFLVIFISMELNVPQVIACLMLIYIINANLDLFLVNAHQFNSWVFSVKRVDQILRMQKFRGGDDPDGRKGGERGCIELENCYFSWWDPFMEKALSSLIRQKKGAQELEEVRLIRRRGRQAIEEQSSALQDINLRIENEEFLMILGQPRSGKTSILKAIMEEMKLIKGKISKKGKIAYISKKPLLVNDTVRANILFGSLYNPDLYSTVTRICQLKEDFLALPEGDLTEIGVHGFELSVDQKLRVSIARAAYSDSDIYLIDDFSVVGHPYVRAEIFEEVFQKYLSDKTRIMTSQHAEFLDLADRIAILEKGMIVAEGGFEQIQLTGKYREFTEIDRRSHRNTLRGSPNGSNQRVKSRKEVEAEMTTKRVVNPFAVTDFNLSKEEDPESITLSNLSEAQNSPPRPINFEVLLFYIRNGGKFRAACIIATTALSEILVILMYWWLGKMTDVNSGRRTFTSNITFYTAIMIIFFLTDLLKNYLISSFCTNSSLSIFRTLVWNMMRKPMLFFETTRPQHILGRVVDNMETTDLEVPGLLICLLKDVGRIFGCVVLVMIINPFLIGVILVIGLIVRQIYLVYLRNRVELGRLVFEAREVVSGSIRGMVSGLTEVRAYNYQGFLERRWERFHDFEILCQLHAKYSEIWIGLWANVNLVLLVLGVGVTIVFTRAYG